MREYNTMVESNGDHESAIVMSLPDILVRGLDAIEKHNTSFLLYLQRDSNKQELVRVQMINGYRIYPPLHEPRPGIADPHYRFRLHKPMEIRLQIFFPSGEVLCMHSLFIIRQQLHANRMASRPSRLSNLA